MKKVLSILLAVLMIASTVAITGIVTTSAADTNPSDDAYVYYTAASDARKSGFAYDFEDFTIDGSDLSKYTAEMWIYIGQPDPNVNPSYDFLISLYPAGHYDADVGANYTEKWAIRKEWKTGTLNVGWNKVTLKLSEFSQGSAGNTYNKAAHAELVSNGTFTAMTLHENSNAGTSVYGSVNLGVSSFTITDGTNTYNVIDPAADKSSSDIVNSMTTNTREGAVGAAMVADLPIPVPVESYDEKVTLVDPAAGKSTDDMYQIGVSAAEQFSIVDTSTLTGGTEGVPSSTAYYIDQQSAVAKTGAMIKVGGDDGVKVANIFDDFIGGELYVNAWVWVDAPSDANIIFRMFERYDNRNSATATFDNYIETGLNNNGVGTLQAGWNYISQNITSLVKASTANSAHGQSYQAFAVENVIRYIAFYSHNTSLCDIAVAAVELSTVDGGSEWDVNIEGKKIVYKLGEETAPEDFIVTDKGAVVDPANYTVSKINTEKAGRQFVTITYNSTEYKYEIYYKTTLGQSVYHTTYTGENANIAGNRNSDNAVIGASSVQHTKTGVATAYHVASTPLNLYGEDTLEMYIYFEKDCITAMNADAAVDAIQLFIEPTSNMGTNGRNGVRIILTDDFFIGQNCKAGWNKVNIPLNPGTYGNQADSPKVNGIQTNWAHDSQTSVVGAMYMNYENVTDYRIRFGKFAGTVALINAVGYGMDTYVNDQHAGNDLATAVANAKDGDTITLNWNETVSETVYVDKDITIDLNGNNIYGSVDPIIKVEGGSLNLIDTNTKYNHSISGANVLPANKGSIIANKNGISAIGLRGALTETAETYTYLNVSKDVTIVADYGVDVIPTNNRQGDGSCYGVVADLYGDMETTGTWSYGECNVYVNGNCIGTPVINIYSGNYDVDEGSSHLAIAGVADVNVIGGVFNDNLLGGTSTTPEANAALEVTGGIFLADDSYEAGAGEMTYIDADDASIAYAGNWKAITNLKGAANKTLMRSTDAGDSYTFAFTGTAFSLNGYTSPTYGKIQIDVDGTKYTVDLYSAEMTYQKHIFGAVVADGTHTVTVTALNSKNSAAERPTLFYNAIDGIDVAGELVDLATAGASLGNKDVTISKNTATFEIENAFINGVEQTGLVASAQYGAVTVDGNAITYTAGAYSDVITYYMNGVKGTITVTVAAGANLEIEVIGTSKDINNNIIENDVMYSWYFSGHNAVILDQGEYVEFTFEGTGFDVISYKSQKYGRMAVYVDGVELDVYNLKASGYNYQQKVYTVDGLDDTEHTVQLVAIGKGIVDAVVTR